jgi:hypothetical protein
MKSFTEVLLNANNLEEEINQAFAFLGESNLQVIAEYSCPLCNNSQLKISGDGNFICCSNIYCNFRREI